MLPSMLIFLLLACFPLPGTESLRSAVTRVEPANFCVPLQSVCRTPLRLITGPRERKASATVTMLNRAKRNAQPNEEGRNLFSSPQSEPSGLSSLGGDSGTTTLGETDDFSSWGPSKLSTTGVFVSARNEIQNWISRSLLSKNEGDIAPLQAVIDEFKSEEELIRVSGAAIGDSLTGPQSWVKLDPNRDIDPSGCMAAAVENIGKAAAMNISYIEYVDRFVKPSRQPTVETILPNRRQLPDNVYQLVTVPFTYPVYSLLPRVPYCTCWYGLFFELEAIDRDLEITGLYAQSGEYHNDMQDLSNISVYSRLGQARGAECSSEGWILVGEASNVRLPRANFTSSTSPRYGRLPMSPLTDATDQRADAAAAAALQVRAGETRSFLVTTTSSRGIVLRAKHQSAWTAGEETERDEHLIIRSGLLPCRWEDLGDAALRQVFHESNSAAFVGVVDYRLVDATN